MSWLGSVLFSRLFERTLLKPHFPLVCLWLLSKTWGLSLAEKQLESGSLRQTEREREFRISLPHGVQVASPMAAPVLGDKWEIKSQKALTSPDRTAVTFVHLATDRKLHQGDHEFRAWGRNDLPPGPGKGVAILKLVLCLSPRHPALSGTPSGSVWSLVLALWNVSHTALKNLLGCSRS